MCRTPWACLGYRPVFDRNIAPFDNETSMTRAWWCLLLAALAVLAVACSSSGDNATTTATKTAAATQSGAAATVAPTSNCPAPITDTGVPSMKTYAAAPANTIDASKTYIATVKTVRGDFTIKLRPDLAPKHVNSFVFLARDGYFDHVTFHRVIPGFVAQAGRPDGHRVRRPRLHDARRVHDVCAVHPRCRWHGAHNRPEQRGQPVVRHSAELHQSSRLHAAWTASTPSSGR